MQKTYVEDVIDSKSTRLRQLREGLFLTQSQFAELLGIDQTNITKYERGKLKVGKSVEFRLFQKIGNLNNLWWETGDGAMFLSGVSEPVADYVAVKRIPYYDVDVAARDLTFFNSETPDKPTALLEVPFFVDCEFAVRVYGNSMAERFCAGDVIFCKEVSHWRDFVSFGEPYLIVYGDGERRVKYLKRSEKPGCYRLSSENKHYDDYDVPLSLIHHIYLVKGKLEKTSM